MIQFSSPTRMSLPSLSLVLFAVFVLLATCVHGAHVEPNDVIKTIESECGDIIDCVDIYKQPALKNSLLRDHKIQEETTVFLSKHGNEAVAVQMELSRFGGSLLPIGVDDYAANLSLPFFSYARPTDEGILDEGNGKLEIAAAYAVNGPYHGATAAIPIWKVQVEPNEFSKNYLLIASPHERRFVPIIRKDPPDIKNQIAVGMAVKVYPSVLGDDNSRLYIYATNDGGVNSHCLNHDCGFIQTNKQYALGTKFRNSDSKVGGDLYFVPVGLYRQTGPAVWWLSINEVAIGYFDPSWFPVPFIESFHNEMGGLDTRPGGRHTTTPMGSGMYASAGTNNAASIAYYLAINNNGGDQVDDPVNNIITHPKCYDVKDFGQDLDHPGADISYGGPGGYYCDQ